MSTDGPELKYVSEWTRLGKRMRWMMQLRGVTSEVLAKQTYLPERVLPLLMDGLFTATPEGMEADPRGLELARVGRSTDRYHRRGGI